MRISYGPCWLSVSTLKPGITGMAQVHGRGELTIEERSILDAEYVRDYSLWHWRRPQCGSTATAWGRAPERLTR